MFPMKAVVALVLGALTLLGIVITVSLIRDNLNASQTVLALSTMVSGIAIAALTRKE